MRDLSEILLNIPDWMLRGRCLDADPEIFFPEHGCHQDIEAAKRICDTCPVRKKCLEYALAMQSTYDEYGVFGGTSVRDRRRIRLERSRRIAS